MSWWTEHASGPAEDAPTPPLEPGTAASEPVLRSAVALGRGLRAAGMAGDVDRQLAFCRALADLDLRDRHRVRAAGRACFVTDPSERAVFDAVFERFWAGEALGLEERMAEHGESDPRMPGPQHGGESLPQYRQEGKSSRLLGGGEARATREIPTNPGDEAGEGHRRGVIAAYSPAEVETEKDPLGFGTDEVVALRRLTDELRAAAPLRRSRRLAASRGSGRLDVRRTLRRSLATEGEALRPAFSSPRERPRRLLFLCDVSGSMERYSRALLGSLQAAVGAGIRAEAFVFATSLTRVTKTLRSHDVAGAIERARQAIPDWSGGTRIGAAIHDFNRDYAGLGLARGAVTVVVSDGWDRGDPALLSTQLERLRRQSRRLVWLNPRPGEPDGQPLATGMRAALGHVDDFVPGHDPRAGGDLARLLRGVGARPARSPMYAVGR